MNAKQLTPHDWQRLSDYLDGQLPPQERTALEAQLAHDPALRQALEELRFIQSALRALPTVRAPRAFTLPREAARPVRRARALRWAAALAYALAALLFTAELTSGWWAPRMAAAPPPAYDTAPATEMPAAEKVAPPLAVQALPEEATGEAESGLAPAEPPHRPMTTPMPFTRPSPTPSVAKGTPQVSAGLTPIVSTPYAVNTTPLSQTSATSPPPPTPQPAPTTTRLPWGWLALGLLGLGLLLDLLARYILQR